MTGKDRKRTALDATTLQPASVRTPLEAIRAVALTILGHPDPARVGERSLLNDPAAGPRVRVSRLLPAFGPPGETDAVPLADSHLSRKPFFLEPREDGSVELSPEPGASPVTLDGAVIDGPRLFEPAAVDAGVVLEISERVVVLLHRVHPFRQQAAAFGLAGASDAILEVREQILRVASHDVPVLLRGESGTGKELVAQAIHQASERQDQPFVSVNVAAIPTTTAAAALFGHAKGAFTGAEQASVGYFGQADGGTLFLDEIGDAPTELQPALLRALETGEVQPVGDAAPTRRDVRLLAATDADLERAVEQGRFRLPLLQRLSGYELTVPPLRERREDIGRLLRHFLREELERAGHPERLSAPEGRGRPWLPAWVVSLAACHDWPGNVRQLRNAARQLVIAHGDKDEVPRVDGVTRLFRSVAPGESKKAQPSSSSRPPLPKRALRDISEDELIAALERHDHKPGPAAKQLGVARSSLYELMERSPRIRKASELEQAEIEHELAAHSGDVRAAAGTLKVSERGLRLRMKQLGLDAG